jgi:hypothetical protein
MSIEENHSEQSAAERYDRLAFTLCKAAFLMLLLQRFALPVTSLACAIAYLLAAYHGQKTTRCWARYPLLIAGLWLIVSAAAWLAVLDPHLWAAAKGDARAILGRTRPTETAP